MTQGTVAHTAGNSIFSASNMNAVTWTDCTFTPGNGCNGLWNNVTGCDFTTCTWNGATWANRQIYQTNCSGNTGLPTQ
jgi:hypothetical protein